MSTDTSNSNRKFQEALELLNEAAKEKKEEIQNLVGNRYSHIKEALQGATADRLADLEDFKKTAQDVAQGVDKNVRSNPWTYIGGAALGALLLGYILGSSKK